MECSIIRDLFPSYIDGLTSEESNHIIEEHLRECTECREFLEGMKADLASVKYVELNKAQAETEISVFKKIRRRMIYAVIITAVVAAVLCDVYIGYFTGGVSTLPGEVEVSYKNVDGVVMIGLIPKKNNVYIQGGSHVSSDYHEEGFDEQIIPINCHISPRTIPKEQRGFYLRYIFRDDGTVIYENSYADLIELQGDEALNIEFGTKTASMTVSDFRTEAGAEKLRQWLKTEEEELKD